MNDHGWMEVGNGNGLKWMEMDGNGSRNWKTNLSRNPETEPHSAGERG